LIFLITKAVILVNVIQIAANLMKKTAQQQLYFTKKSMIIKKKNSFHKVRTSDIFLIRDKEAIFLNNINKENNKINKKKIKKLKSKFVSKHPYHPKSMFKLNILIKLN